MSTAKKPESFASNCLDSLKGTIARQIRHQITTHRMKYPVAEQIFGLSGASLSRIMNHKENLISFETLHNAAVTAGMSVSMVLTVPD
ncbi:hypothetical protein HOT57_gp35 [Pseudomonas phage phCDa]|uniref:Uncharacterized protein n=1 Tax=Pseudomonas phage phCDa TaxID=2268587 RepID=A0A2Z5H958_9CAUD|nr:hypothetical protein HOT57_gp35 [Pseudomonas phage phCDa]AXC36479.1 hypothetical protein phCDa_35 [Pseudomonas phage phCDa]